MKALVLGKGKSGAAAAALLRARGCEVDFAAGYELVVASPGVPVRSELQLGCEELRRRGWKLLAVTGSKGKSSVVKLVAEALGGVPCGNYGLPASELAFPPPDAKGEPPSAKWAVVEVSSFQLETTSLKPDTFEAAAILNLQEDHLDRHGCVEVYHALKRRLLTMTRQPVDAGCLASLRPCAHLLAGSYFDNPILRENGLCAIALLKAAGLGEAAIARAFAAFEPLPHRMNLVCEREGVRYVDDSKATSLKALEAGVLMAYGTGLRPVRLIAGGLPKGDDPKSVISTLTNRVRKVYLIGQCAKEFLAAWQASVDCEICETMGRAVERILSEVESGETVLLSPGTASFDQFESFGERGEAFARLVQKGKKE